MVRHARAFTCLWQSYRLMSYSSWWMMICLQSCPRIVDVCIAELTWCLVVRNLTCSCALHFSMRWSKIPMWRWVGTGISWLIVNCNNHIVWVCLLRLMLVVLLSVIRIASSVWGTGIMKTPRGRGTSMHGCIVVMMSRWIDTSLLEYRDVDQSRYLWGICHLWHDKVLGRVENHSLVLQEVPYHLFLMLQQIGQSPSGLRAILSHYLLCILLLLLLSPT